MLIQCTPKSSQAVLSGSHEKPFKIICTIGQLKDLTESLVGTKATIHSLCKAGTDPHTYVATVNEIQRIRKADLIYGIGLHLEAQMLHFLKKMPHAVLVGEVAINSKELIEWKVNKSLSAYDPHIWGDVSLWMQVCRYVKEDLIKRMPQEKALIESNAKRYLEELAETHYAIKQMILTIPKERRLLLTSHDAFSYFSRAYGIETKALLGLSPETEASPKEVIELSKWIITHKVKVAFGETSVPNKFLEAVIQSVKSQGHSLRLSAHALYSDSMGHENTPTGTYIGMMQHNASIIAADLQHAE